MLRDQPKGVEGRVVQGDRGGARLHDLALRAARFVRAAVPLDNQIDLEGPFADVVVARDFALDGAAVVERDDAFQPALDLASAINGSNSLEPTGRGGAGVGRTRRADKAPLHHLPMEYALPAHHLR